MQALQVERSDISSSLEVPDEQEEVATSIQIVRGIKRFSVNKNGSEEIPSTQPQASKFTHLSRSDKIFTEEDLPEVIEVGLKPEVVQTNVAYPAQVDSPKTKADCTVEEKPIMVIPVAEEPLEEKLFQNMEQILE